MGDEIQKCGLNKFEIHAQGSPTELKKYLYLMILLGNKRKKKREWERERETLHHWFIP